MGDPVGRGGCEEGSQVDGALGSHVDGALGSHVDGALGSHVDGALGSHVDGALGSHVDGALGSHVDGALGSHVDGALGSHVDGALGCHVDGALGCHVDGALGCQVYGKPDDVEPGFGDCAWEPRAGSAKPRIPAVAAAVATNVTTAQRRWPGGRATCLTFWPSPSGHVPRTFMPLASLVIWFLPESSTTFVAAHLS